MIKRFAAAWRFLTVFPFLWPAGRDEGELLRGSAPMFPVVGLVLGCAGALFAAGASLLLPPSAVAALCVALLALYSCGLHLDGLADCADALLSPGREPEKALAIMKDSRIGAHGAMALCLLLLTKYACLASLPPERLPWAMLAVPVAGRAAMLFPMAKLPYLRAEGLGRLFETRAMASAMPVAGVCLVFATLVALGGTGFWLGLVLFSATVWGWTLFLKARLGGAVGDCYGAACELAETALALAAAASAHLFGG